MSRKKVFCFFVSVAIATAVQAQCEAEYFTGFTSPTALNYVIEFSTFPFVLSDTIDAAVDAAADEWDEEGCNEGLALPATPPISNLNAAPNDRAVNLRIAFAEIGSEFPCETVPAEPCTHSMYTFLPSGERDFTLILVYEKMLVEGVEVDLMPVWANQDRLMVVMAHEMGHALGLKHDSCEGSIMQPVVDPSLIVLRSHCDKVEEEFRKVDPLDEIALLDRCYLGGYCNQNNQPWFGTKPICYWTENWSMITTIDQFGDTEVTEAYYRDYGCIDAYGATGAAEVAQWVHEPVPSPRLALIPPTEAVAPPELTVRGWAYSGQLPVRQFGFWIDGVWTQPSAMLDEVYSPALCATGFDPANCSETSGFEAQLPIDGLSNGAHRLEVVVTNHWNEPLPVYLSYEFEVDHGEPPVAVDDEAFASYAIVHYPDRTEIQDSSVDIPVLANDYDPDGGAVSVVRIVAQPESGTVETLPNGLIRYTTDGANPGSPVFSYEIRDDEGEVDRAIVEVTVLSSVVVVDIEPTP